MPEFESQPYFEIARRLEIRGETGWLAVLTPVTESTAALDQLQTELQSILQKPARVIQLEPSTFEELREALHQPDDDAVILSRGTGLTPEKWRSLDIMRSALERKGPVILWLASDDIANLAESRAQYPQLDWWQHLRRRPGRRHHDGNGTPRAVKGTQRTFWI